MTPRSNCHACGATLEDRPGPQVICVMCRTAFPLSSGTGPVGNKTWSCLACGHTWTQRPKDSRLGSRSEVSRGAN